MEVFTHGDQKTEPEDAMLLKSGGFNVRYGRCVRNKFNVHTTKAVHRYICICLTEGIQRPALTYICRIKTIRIDEGCFVMYSHVRPKRTNDIKLDEIHTWWYMTR